MRESVRNSGHGDIAGRVDALIHDLKQKNSLRSHAVEAAFRAVPRHLFLPGVPLEDV